MKEAAFRANDIEAPAIPIPNGPIQLMPQLVRSLLGLSLGGLQVGNLDPRIVEDLIMALYEVEVAAHLMSFPPQPLRTL